MLKKILLSVALCSSVFCLLGNAQDCSPPSIVANANSANLFSPEQEMIFGELTIQQRVGDIRLVHDEKSLAYINEIGTRLAKHLPPTGLRFQYHLVDIPEVNAFNIPGGHVFLTRKLIAFVNNEDELAGVIAHELGHAVVRHAAVGVSEWLKKLLGVTALGDRKDITLKYHLLIDRARTKRISGNRDHESEQQLEADKIGIFAMAAAGYDPEARYVYRDRLTESGGKTGSWFSELFGTTNPVQKRMREMIHVIKQLPPACRDGRAAKATEDFLKWQASVISIPRETGRKEELPGLIWKKELAPKLRSDVYHFAFSQDGKYLLAQDDVAVTVIEREPQRVLFQVPAINSREAFFTPDNQFVVLTTNDLRYEKWNIAEKKPVEVRELALRQRCIHHKLSPDANYLACISSPANPYNRSTNAYILDVRTGVKVWEKKDLYELDDYELRYWLEATASGDRHAGLFHIQFSPDSQFVIFSHSSMFRFLNFPDAAAAFDLTSLKAIELGDDLKKICSRAFIFLDSEKILGLPTGRPEDAGIFSFPSGRRIQKFAFGAREIKRTANPDYVIIKPLANAKMGIFDLKRRITVLEVNQDDATVWNNLMAYQAPTGEILIREVTYNTAQEKLDGKDVGAIEIPVGLSRGFYAAQVSDNFNWLLLSSKSRGGLWNLATGERKVYVRGFKGGLVADNGGAIAEFPKLDEGQHRLGVLNPRSETVAALRDLPEKGARQYGRFVLLRRSLKEDKNAERKYLDYFFPDYDDFLLSQDVRFELRDLVQDKIVWSRDFAGEAPQYSFDGFAGRLIFYWSLGNNAGKSKLNQTPELKAKAKALGDKLDDYLVEIVDAFTQRTAGMMLLETGQGSFNVGGGLSEGTWLMLHDSEGRLLIYSIKDGGLRHRFFGGIAAINPRRNQIAVENFPGEIELYNLDTGDRNATAIINGRAVFVRFNLEGDKLFVLSNTQSVYVFDLNKVETKTAIQTK